MLDKFNLLIQIDIEWMHFCNGKSFYKIGLFFINSELNLREIKYEYLPQY